MASCQLLTGSQDKNEAESWTVKLDFASTSACANMHIMCGICESTLESLLVALGRSNAQLRSQHSAAVVVAKQSDLCIVWENV